MGLAILAGSLGLAFANIDKISRFKGAGFEAEMNKVETIIDSQTEPTPEQEKEAKNVGTLTEVENIILKSLQRPGYTWRYSKTIASEISQTSRETEKTLKFLMTRGLAKRSQGSNGEIWATTVIGKSAQEQHELRGT